MPKRTGLGKGLDALIPAGQSVPSADGGGGITHISVDLIQRNPRQPREKFDIEELDNLAESIREHGVIQPLIVSPAQNGIYVLIAGERRDKMVFERVVASLDRKSRQLQPGNPPLGALFKLLNHLRRQFEAHHVVQE